MENHPFLLFLFSSYRVLRIENVNYGSNMVLIGLILTNALFQVILNPELGNSHFYLTLLSISGGCVLLGRKQEI